MCQEVKKVMGSWQYCIIAKKSFQKTLLNKKRKGILDEVHLKEKQLSRIDYLRYEMDWENKG